MLHFFFFQAILTLTKDGNSLVAEDCYLALVNLSTEDHTVEFVMKRYIIIPEFIKIICDADSQFSDHCCMIVSNISRTNTGSKQCYDILFKNDPNFLSLLLDVFSNTNYNKRKCNLDYLGSVFANLTQLPEGMQVFITVICKVLTRKKKDHSTIKAERKVNYFLCIEANGSMNEIQLVAYLSSYLKKAIKAQ